jgi:predicted dehydrogenase
VIQRARLSAVIAIVVLLGLGLGLTMDGPPSGAPFVVQTAHAHAGQATEAPLRLAIAGVTHGHVHGFMRRFRDRTDVEIVGVYEADATLRAAFAERYKLPASKVFGELPTLLDAVKPEAVAAFTNTFDHKIVIETAATRGVHVMVEKPLAVSVDHARAIARAASRARIHVIVNYETTWYASHAAIWTLMKEQKAAGAIRKVVAMDGHFGPKEIGVQPEFLSWLTDPVKNGAGALFDFGCYGANLTTWLLDNERPRAVTAIAQTIKPAIYARVDDEATIVMEYAGAQGIAQASWNWPDHRKDLEVYGESGYAIATGGNSVRVRMRGQKETAQTPDPLAADVRDELSYLKAVVRGRFEPSGLSSLENNLIVTEILAAARESARTGRTVRLAPQ